MWLYILLLLFAVLWLLLLLSNIEVKVVFIKSGSDQKLQLFMKALWGIVSYHYEGSAESRRERKAARDDEKNRPARRSLQHIQDLYKIKKQVTGFGEWFKDALSHVQCTQLHWDTTIGTGDAVSTATLCGLVWSVKGPLVGWLSSNIRMLSAPQLQVLPYYRGVSMHTELRLKVKLRIFHGIVTGLRLIIRVARRRGGLRVWVHRIHKLYISKKRYQVKVDHS